VDRDAVVCREHQDIDAIEPGRAAAPLGHPRNDFFKPAQAAGRLGELGLTGVDCGRRRRIALLQIDAGSAERGE
jgi:hypothetical protein